MGPNAFVYSEGGSISRFCIGAVCAYIAIIAYGDAGYRW